MTKSVDQAMSPYNDEDSKGSLRGNERRGEGGLNRIYEKKARVIGASMAGCNPTTSGSTIWVYLPGNRQGENHLTLPLNP